MKALLLSAFATRRPATSPVGHCLNRGNVEERHVRPLLAVWKNNKYFGLQQHCVVGADHFVRLSARDDKTKRQKRITIQQLPNVFCRRIHSEAVA